MDEWTLISEDPTVCTSCMEEKETLLVYPCCMKKLCPSCKTKFGSFCPTCLGIEWLGYLPPKDRAREYVKKRPNSLDHKLLEFFLSLVPEAKDSKDDFGNTPLHSYLSFCSSPAPKFVALLGTVENTKLKNIWGYTPKEIYLNRFASPSPKVLPLLS